MYRNIGPFLVFSPRTYDKAQKSMTRFFQPAVKNA